MGGLSTILAPKRPKPAPIQITRTNSNPDTGQAASPLPPSTPTDAELEAQRAEDALRRARGQSSTILTSFRGVLTPDDARPARKTLLGE